MKRSRQVAKRLNTGVKSLLKKNKVEVYDGFGRLTGAGKVAVEGADGSSSELTAGSIILATGARARSLPGLEADGELVWSYKEAMVPTDLPARLLVVGSGAIGIEFASFYNELGSEVTVVEALPRILPVEDEEISQLAHKEFEKQGMEIHVSSTVSSLERGKGEVKATITPEEGEPKVATFDRVILAVGIVGNVENLGLEGTGVEVDRTHIVTNEWTETGEPGVYAIGDVAGPPWLAHKATHEGIVCAERIAGQSTVHPMKTERIPGCTYCRPQIASVGLTEAKAKELGREIRVGRFPFRRQRQGDRARRDRGPRQDDLRRRNGRAARRAPDRRRGHRADPGLRRGHESRDDRGGADAHDLRASDALGDDARVGSGSLWSGHPYLAWSARAPHGMRGTRAGPKGPPSDEAGGPAPGDSIGRSAVTDRRGTRQRGASPSGRPGSGCASPPTRRSKRPGH